MLALSFAAVASSHEDWAALRAIISVTLHIQTPPLNLEAKRFGKFSPSSGVEAERVSYVTALALRVPAIVYHAAGATIEKHPGLVIVNGHGGDKSSWYAYWSGILYARAGAVVLTYDPIGEFERNKHQKSNTQQHDTFVQPADDIGLRLSGLMVTDVMQAVRYLAQRPDVDPKHIAVLGYSLGSFVSALTCAIDTDVYACVLVGGGNLDGPGGHWDTKTSEMCEQIPYRALLQLGDRGSVLYALSAKRGPELVFNGSADSAAGIVSEGPTFFADLRRRAMTLGVNSKEIFSFEFSNGSGHAPYFLTKPVALWLQDKLKFPNWKRKQIEAMPETKAGDWAAQNHVSLSQDEAGVVALGLPISPVAREDLRAIPASVWEADQDSYIYESWRARALNSFRSGTP